MAALKHSSPFHSARPVAKGFTLIEMMISITILGILLVFAVPAFRSFIIDQRIKNASFELNTSLQYARSEAVKRRQQVSISPTGGNWADGYSITYPDDDDTDSDAEVVKTVGAQQGIAISGPTIVTFRGDGRTAAGGGSSFEIGSSPARTG